MKNGFLGINAFGIADEVHNGRVVVPNRSVEAHNRLYQFTNASNKLGIQAGLFG